MLSANGYFIREGSAWLLAEPFETPPWVSREVLHWPNLQPDEDVWRRGIWQLPRLQAL